MPVAPENHKSLTVPGYSAKAPPYVDHRASAASRGYDSTWRRLRLMVLHNSPLCALCGAPARDVHHVKPISRGGDRLETANLQTLCQSCHARLQGEKDYGRTT